MDIVIYENSQINKQQIINNGLELFLNTLKRKTIINSNLSIFKKNNFSITIQKSEIDNIVLTNIDLCRVSNYPYTNQEWTYFNLTNIEYLNDSQYKLTFEINETQTYFINLILNSETSVRIFRSHVNYSNQWSDFNLKDNSILKLSQSINSDAEFREINYKNALANDQTLLMLEGVGITRWAVAFVSKDYFNSATAGEVSHLTKNYDEENENSQQMEKQYITVFSPITSSSSKIDFADATGTVQASISGKELINALAKESNDKVPFITIIDQFPLSNVLSWDSANNRLSIRYINLNEEFVILNDSNENPIGFWKKNIFLDKENNNIKNDLLLINDSDFKIRYRSSPDKNISDEWEIEEEEILNFFPFKKMEISNPNEEFGAGTIIDYDNLGKILTGDKIATYFWSFTPFAFSYNIQINDKYYYQKIFNISKSLSVNKSVEQWLNYKQEQSGGALGDYLIPAAEAAASAALATTTGGFSRAAGAALAVNSGISTANTYLSHKNMQKRPASINSTSKELENEIIRGYSFISNVKILELKDSQKRTIAFDFHQKGLLFFNNFYKKIDFLNQKQLFNFLQISSLENEYIFNNNIPSFYKDRILKNYKNGVHIWNYFSSDPDTIFNFSKSNPDLEI